MKGLVLFSSLLVLLSHRLCAVDRTFVVVTNVAMVNHWPAGDLYLGTEDDLVGAALSQIGGSSPNASGTYSFIAAFPDTQRLDPFFPGFDYVTFVLGSTVIDTDSFLTNDIPLIKSLQFSGTELFPGHGAYSVKLTNPGAGSYAHTNNVFTFFTPFDFEGTFVAGIARATNASVNGLVLLIEAKDFDSPVTSPAGSLTGYAQAVVIPLAKNLGASALLCGYMNLQSAGAIPGTPGFFPPLSGYAVVVAMEFGGNAVQLRITSIEVTAAGVDLKWSSLTGRTYAVEFTDSLGSPFTLLAANLTQAEYIDTSARAKDARFYRIRSP